MYFTMGKPQELTHYAMMKAVPLLTALQLFLDFPAVWISDNFGWCETGSGHVLKKRFRTFIKKKFRHNFSWSHFEKLSAF